MIVILFTGGTISMKFDAAQGGAVPTLSGEEIVTATRGLTDVAPLEVEQWGRYPGPHMTVERMWALRNRIIVLMGYGNLSITTRALEEMGERISKYLSTQLAINTSFGLLVAIALALIGLPYAFLWGFLAALLIFVPVIGFWLAAGEVLRGIFLIFLRVLHALFLPQVGLGLRHRSEHFLEPLILRCAWRLDLVHDFAHLDD